MYGRPGARACSGSHLKSSDISLYSVVRTPGALRTPGVRFSSPLPARNRLVLQFTSVWPDLAAAKLLAACNPLCLIAAPAPRGCNCASQAKKACRRQFSPLGTAGCVMNPAQSCRIFNPAGLQTWFRRITNHAGTGSDFFRSLERKPDADCGRGRLFPRFRLASRSSASEDANRGGIAAYAGTSRNYRTGHVWQTVSQSGSAKRGEAHRIKEKRLAQKESAPIVWNCGGTAARNHFMPA